MEIPKELNDEIWEYCRINNITDINGFIIKLVKQGFTIQKYGATPYAIDNGPKEVEVIKVVKEEVIKEVPVEVIKEVYISNNKEVNEMASVIEELKLGLSNEVKNYMDYVEQTKIDFKEYSDKVLRLDNELLGIKKELEIERAKPKLKESIYQENKKGFFGSNTNDLQI